MRYKEVINRAFEVKEKLKGEDKEIIENLMSYTNKIYAKLKLIETARQPEILDEPVIKIENQVLPQNNVIYFKDEEIDYFKRSNEKLKLKLRKVDRRRRYLEEIMKSKRRRWNYGIWNKWWYLDY